MFSFNYERIIPMPGSKTLSFSCCAAKLRAHSIWRKFVMKNLILIFILFAICLIFSAADSATDVLSPLPAGSIHLSGHIASRIDLVIANQIASQNYPMLVEPFRTRPESTPADWKCEFWGKCFRSLHEAYRYNQSPSIKAKMDSTVADLLSTQTTDGYIGTYATPYQLNGWDVWGRKYVLLGLLRYYDLTRSDSILQAMVKEVDYLLTQVGTSPKRDITYTGCQAGLASCSILEPIVQLYNVTGYQRYLDFANYIASIGCTSGNNLISGAIRGDKPAQLANGKAYEMTSVFEGLVELYRVTDNPDYIQACLNFWQGVVDHELVITGTAGSGEMWENTYYGQATKEGLACGCLCTGVTWGIKYAYQLLRLTGDPKYADQIEKTFYNDLLGAYLPDGSWNSYFSKLNGNRARSYIQHLNLSCCLANGPMGMAQIPEVAVMSKSSGPVLNLYCAGTATVPVSGNNVLITQVTEYPKSDTIIINVKPTTTANFTVSLRIPEWSDVSHTSLTINGGANIAVIPGTYQEINRTWSSSGDQIVLVLDMRGRRIIDYSTAYSAILRGPLVLARDTRFTNNMQDSIITDSAGYVSLTEATPPTGIWMEFQAPSPNGAIVLVDYSSAGNDFMSGYSTWVHYYGDSYVDSTTDVTLANPGFESPVINGIQGNPSGAGWTFTSAGIQQNGSAFGAKNAPQGSQTAYLQGTCTVSQTVAFEQGSYIIFFQASRRAVRDNIEIQSFDVSFDNNKIGTFAPLSGFFVKCSTSIFMASTGEHLISFTGKSSTDLTDFIDAIRIKKAEGTAVSMNFPTIPGMEIKAAPNPFNSAVTIYYALPPNTKATYRIFNMQGQLVYTAVLQAGIRGRQGMLAWHGQNLQGEAVPSGVYTGRLATSSGKILTNIMEYIK